MRIPLLFFAVAISTAAAAAAVPELVKELEEAAPTVECRPATFEKEEWCWAKIRLPDGSRVGFVAHFEGDELKVAWRLIDRPLKTTSSPTQ